MSAGEDRAAAGVAASLAPAGARGGGTPYLLGVLLIIYILSFIDRQIVNILAESIKAELGLADWQIGMMTGLAFAICYAGLGLPIARIAERANRVNIIAASVATWSAFTVLCGFAQSYIHLLLARVGVGIGEAGCTPAAHSLIADCTPADRRATALSVYMLGGPVGSLAGLMIGGLIADQWGWRTAFVVCGAPGLLFALLAYATLRDPRSRRQIESPPRVPLLAALADFKGRTTFWLIAFGASTASFVAYGMTAFIPSFMMRAHGDELAGLGAGVGLEVAGLVGLLLGIGGGTLGVAGTLFGGAWTDRLIARDLRAYAIVPAAGLALGVPFYLGAFLTSSATLCVVLICVFIFCASIWQGPLYAAIQRLVPETSRATAAAVTMLLTNLIGLGLGPLWVGVVSDASTGVLGDDPGTGLRNGLLALAPVSLIAIALLLAAGRRIRQQIL